MLRKIFMKNDLSKERFRNEWKYLISTSEKELLDLRMKHLLKKDPNAQEFTAVSKYVLCYEKSQYLHGFEYWNETQERKLL